MSPQKEAVVKVIEADRLIFRTGNNPIILAHLFISIPLRNSGYTGSNRRGAKRKTKLNCCVNIVTNSLYIKSMQRISGITGKCAGN